MKKMTAILMALAISTVFVFSVSAAEKAVTSAKSKQVAGQPSQAYVPSGTVFAGCPPGFQGSGNQNTASFKCLKNNPANPCQPGYHVKWGPCASSDPQCSYSCIADMPSAAAKNNFDKAICGKEAKKTVSVTPCAMFCVDILY